MNQHEDNENRNRAASETPLILAVDDDEAIRMLMKVALDGYGFRVEVVENGRKAVDAFGKLNFHEAQSRSFRGGSSEFVFGQ